MFRMVRARQLSASDSMRHRPGTYLDALRGTNATTPLPSTSEEPMQSAHLKLLTGFAASAAIVLSTWLPASAGAFNVKPIRVFLSKDGTSTVVTIENQDQNV